MHRLSVILSRRLKPWSQRLRKQLADRLRHLPAGRRTKPRQREIQLEFRWNSKI